MNDPFRTRVEIGRSGAGPLKLLDTTTTSLSRSLPLGLYFPNFNPDRRGRGGRCVVLQTLIPMANPLYGSGPLRSREGLTSRPVAGSDEIQLRIDPMNADLDEEITGLHRKIRQLKGVAQEIETEAKSQNDLITQLQMTLIKAQAGVKNNMRRMNKSIIQHGSNHVAHVVLFALFCFFVVYLWSKFSRR